ncbi:MAG: sulfite exporter TauE/SafE family protein [Candidatus Omnitrophica bacterium]|nr:sulfite exporter TauE/SafE family protein [Candidatus Omnitrophota bacterium]
MIILKALALGFSTGAFCLGHCVPVLAPFLLARQDETSQNLVHRVAFFLLGRLLAYLLFGLIVGLFGSYVKEVVVVQRTVVPWLFLVLGASMVVFGLLETFPHRQVCGMRSRTLGGGWHLFAAGFLTGVNLCPPFMLTLSYALSLGGVLRSLVFFFFFFCATTVFLVPFLFSRLLSRFQVVRQAARIVAVMVGIWFMAGAVTHLTR